MLPDDMYKDKRFTELGYVPISDKQACNKKLHRMGYSLDLMSNKETKVFHNPTICKVTMAILLCNDMTWG